MRLKSAPRCAVHPDPRCNNKWLNTPPGCIGPYCALNVGGIRYIQVSTNEGALIEGAECLIASSTEMHRLVVGTTKCTTLRRRMTACPTRRIGSRSATTHTAQTRSTPPSVTTATPTGVAGVCRVATRPDRTGFRRDSGNHFRRIPRDPSVFVVGTVGPTSKKSGGLLPPLEKLQKLAELAAAAPADSDADLDETGRSWLIRRRLSDEQVAELVELYRSGVGTPALSERFGISKPSVLELLHDHGVRMRRQPLTRVQRARAVRLYEEGFAIKPIAAELGSSYGAVHRVLQASGVRLRPRPGR